MTSDDAAEPLDVPYLLALNVGLWQAPDGAFHADPSWAKDLLRHTAYLPRLTLVAPVAHGTPPADHVRLPDNALRIAGYPAWRGRIGAHLAFAVAATRLLVEVPRARIVHTGIAGYPLPLGWIAIPLARLLGRKTVVTVESSFWRVPAGQPVSRVKRLRAAVWEKVNRWCMRQVDFAAYSHADYRTSLPAPRAGGGTLFQASWIEADQVRGSNEVAVMWSARVAAVGRRPAFLFAARMVTEKGTAVLAAALKQLADARAGIDIHVIGAGPELERLRALTASGWGHEHVRILDAVPYGPPFFRLLRDYDAVLVPSLSNEQPRIVYDAFSQGVPAIGSDLPGMAACVTDGVTGRLVRPGDATALTDAILAAAADPAALARWGKAGREVATGVTHDRMHRDRARDLRRLL